jgi:hypothetical protein
MKPSHNKKADLVVAVVAVTGINGAQAAAGGQSTLPAP